MHSSFAIAALAAVAYAAPHPQGVTEDISPPAGPPAGCSESFTGKFQIAAVNITTATKRDLETRQSSCGAEGSLTLTLADGKLLDAQGRTGYIAANFQFQFDKPAQTGAIFTDGFSACSNGSLGLGGSTVFYQCLSGSFYNLYDRHWAAQCNPVGLQILPCSGASTPSTPSNGVGQVSDGQPTGTAVGAPVTQISDGQVQGPTNIPVVTQLSDGQPQVPTATVAPITQIGDGQVQAPTSTAAPVTQISDGQVQAPTSTAAPVTQISDGQVQAPTSAVAPITQISDGQVQAPTSTVAPITQISDGQVQAPTGTVAPITQISDGQIQAPTSTLAPITQISDGQIQAPTSSLAPVTQISDGQVQAPTGTGVPIPNNTTLPFTGAASTNGVVMSSALMAGFMGLVSVFLL
jgi:hypothetical protein